MNKTLYAARYVVLASHIMGAGWRVVAVLALASSCGRPGIKRTGK